MKCRRPSIKLCLYNHDKQSSRGGGWRAGQQWSRALRGEGNQRTGKPPRFLRPGSQDQSPPFSSHRQQLLLVSNPPLCPQLSPSIGVLRQAPGIPALPLTTREAFAKMLNLSGCPVSHLQKGNCPYPKGWTSPQDIYHKDTGSEHLIVLTIGQGLKSIIKTGFNDSHLMDKESITQSGEVTLTCHTANK